MRRILLLLLTVLLMAALAVPAAADTTTDLILCFRDENKGIPGVQFEIYRVGEKNQKGKLVLTGDFSDYPVELNAAGEDTSDRAAALHGFAKKDKLTPDAAIRTDGNGMAGAHNLPAGLYLIAGLPLRHGDFLYHTKPQLLLLPQQDPTTGTVLENPVLNVKFSKEEDTQQTVSRKVLKIWDDHSGYIRPKSLTVYLLKDGSVYSTVTLNAKNQWRHTWEDLDPAALWQVTEDVPDKYTVTLEQDGTTFLLTNSAPEMLPPKSENSSSSGKIPQTGQLWWPIALLAGLGLLLVAAGFVIPRFLGKTMILLGALLIGGALWMMGGNFREQSQAALQSQEALIRIQLPPKQEQPENTVAQIPDYERNPDMEMPEQIIDGTAYIGTLEIPMLDLNLPVISTTTGENLQKAPCRYSGTPYRENLVVGAHNYSAHFGRLKELSYGDPIQVTDLDGNVFSYQVADIEILQPEQLADLLGGNWPLTLYTCTPGGQSRVTVRCEKR